MNILIHTVGNHNSNSSGGVEATQAASLLVTEIDDATFSGVFGL
jgi:hypothetical protein